MRCTCECEECFSTTVADCNGLTGQPMDDSRQVNLLRQNHGDVFLQHLTEALGRAEQNLPRAAVRVVLVQLAVQTHQRTHSGHTSMKVLSLTQTHSYKTITSSENILALPQNITIKQLLLS